MSWCTKKARVLQLTAPDCVTLLKPLGPSCPASPQATVCVTRDALVPSFVSQQPGAAALGRPSSVAAICARGAKVHLLPLRSCPAWLWNPWWVSIFLHRVFWTIFKYGISAYFSNSTIQLLLSLLAHALRVSGWLSMSWHWLQLLFLPTALVQS